MCMGTPAADFLACQVERPPCREAGEQLPQVGAVAQLREPLLAGRTCHLLTQGPEGLQGDILRIGSTSTSRQPGVGQADERLKVAVP